MGIYLETAAGGRIGTGSNGEIDYANDQGTTLTWQNDTNNAQSAENIAAGETGQNGVPPKEGSGTVEWDSSSSTNATHGIRKSSTITSFDMRDNEIGVWFLNPKKNQDSNELLQTGVTSSGSSIILRVYSGANYADFYQNQHLLGDDTYSGGWLYLRASGAAGAEDASSATWTNTQVAAIDRIGVTVKSQNNNSDKNALEYQLDFAKYYARIVVIGYSDDVVEGDGSVPYTLEDIYNESISNSWGVVTKVENFYKFSCGLQFGDGITSTEFKSTNEYIYLDQSSGDMKYDFIVKNNATVELGDKNAQTLATYSQNGVQLVAPELGQFAPATTPPKCAPALTVESGGILRTYATLIRGFGTIDLGSSGSAALEHLFTDFFDNDEVLFKTTGLTVEDCRLHTDSSDLADLGEVLSVPTSMKRIQVFNCLDGLLFRVTMTVEEYRALGDTTYDLVVEDGDTVTLVNSVIDPASILRVV